MPLAALVPHLAGLRVERVVVQDHRLTLVVAATGASAACPCCRRRSRRVHGRYQRTLADLPWGGRAVALHVRVRRFRCRNRACPRRIFAERFPALARVRARRTDAQRTAVERVGFALGGAAGARLAGHLGLPASRSTVLRLVRAAPLPDVAPPRVLGVDDWARLKGRDYGTILVDLERRRPVDLLPDRTADTLAAWLQRHEGVEIISRDRGGAYADGARQGAPDAVQVADRFHLLANVGETLERVLARRHGCLRAAAAAVDRAAADAGGPSVGDAPTASAAAETSIRPTRAQRDQQVRRERRLARYDAVVSLHEQGLSQCAISDRLGFGRKTIRRYLRAGSFPERSAPRARPTILAAYEPHMRARWTAGCHNARTLWQEIRRQGFPGSASLVRRYVASWRTVPARRGRAARQARVAGVAPSPPDPQPTRARSPRQARWLLLRAPADLRDEDRSYRDHLLVCHPDVLAAYRLTADFGRLVRERRPEVLASWLTEADASGLPEFVAFAAGLRRDHAAVEAALTHGWSNGQTEGQINRLKFLKRQMYGRARFDLLRRRVLHAA